MHTVQLLELELSTCAMLGAGLMCGEKVLSGLHRTFRHCGLSCDAPEHVCSAHTALAKGEIVFGTAAAARGKVWNGKLDTPKWNTWPAEIEYLES